MEYHTPVISHKPMINGISPIGLLELVTYGLQTTIPWMHKDENRSQNGNAQGQN